MCIKLHVPRTSYEKDTWIPCVYELHRPRPGGSCPCAALDDEERQTDGDAARPSPYVEGARTSRLRQSLGRAARGRKDFHLADNVAIQCRDHTRNLCTREECPMFEQWTNYSTHDIAKLPNEQCPLCREHVLQKELEAEPNKEEDAAVEIILPEVFASEVTLCTHWTEGFRSPLPLQLYATQLGREVAQSAFMVFENMRTSSLTSRGQEVPALLTFGGSMFLDGLFADEIFLIFEMQFWDPLLYYDWLIGIRKKAGSPLNR